MRLKRLKCPTMSQVRLQTVDESTFTEPVMALTDVDVAEGNIEQDISTDISTFTPADETAMNTDGLDTSFGPAIDATEPAIMAETVLENADSITINNEAISSDNVVAFNKPDSGFEIVGDKVVSTQPLEFKEKPKTELPGLELLDKPNKKHEPISQEELDHVARLVEEKLLEFNIKANVVDVHPGPVITRFELDLAPGIKVSKITGLSKDLARSLSAMSVRVVEVIPGKSVIGLELPNKYR